MATPTKFHAFIQELGRAGHNLNTATLKWMLSNTAPNASTGATTSDITEISAGSGYSAGGATIANTGYSQSSGTGKLTGDDTVFTASGGSIGPFRYPVLVNATNSKLIGYLDHGSEVTIPDGSTYTLDVSAANGILQVA